MSFFLNRPSWRTTASVVLLAIAAGVVYWPALTGGFLFDDEALLTGSALVKAGDGLYRMWFTSQPIDYWPMTNSSFWLEWRLWGPQPTRDYGTKLFVDVWGPLFALGVLWRVAVFPGPLA